MRKKESSPVIDTVRRVMPAVVSIVISKKLSELESEFQHTNASSKHPKKGSSHLAIPPENVDAHGMVQIGGGSGFIVDEKGIVLTNKHVITEPGADYTVMLSNDIRYLAEILARDPINDVAILRIKAPHDLPTVPLGNSDEIELGQTVLTFGNALGIFKNTVSQGIISGLSRSVDAHPDPASPPQELRGLIQTDAAINPGNSGGPLVDIFGNAIGINAAVVFGAQNIGFAIPIKAAERDLHDLRVFGRIRRPLLGLRYLTLTDDLKEKMKLSVGYGAFVTKEHAFDEAIVPASPAARAGIEEKDIILEWNGEKITKEKSIQDYLENANVGDRVVFTILRGGAKTHCTATLTERK